MGHFTCGEKTHFNVCVNKNYKNIYLFYFCDGINMLNNSQPVN